MNSRLLLVLALLSGIGCFSAKPDKPLLPTTTITGSPSDYDPLIEESAPARFVLLGESTHGTREFIEERWRVTEGIAARRRVLALVIEADAGETDNAASILGPTGAWGATRIYRGYPSWPWATVAFRKALESLRSLNEASPDAEDILFLGFDFHGFGHVLDRLQTLTTGTALSESVAEVGKCLARNEAAYEYRGATRGPTGPCAAQAEALMTATLEEPVSLRSFRLTHLARTLMAAERYHVAIGNGLDAWEVRERYMFDTLTAIDEFFGNTSGAIVVWAHNTHVGAARMTSFRPRPSVGQYFRDTRPGDAYSVGFLTSRGTILAARSIGSPAREMNLNPPLRDSVEHVLARACEKQDCLVTTGRLRSDLDVDRATRAIGLVYRFDDEVRSHYIRSIAARQFDAIVYLDETHAVTSVFP